MQRNRVRKGKPDIDSKDLLIENALAARNDSGVTRNRRVIHRAIHDPLGNPDDAS
jgi:hypothetical protein